VTATVMDGQGVQRSGDVVDPPQVGLSPAGQLGGGLSAQVLAGRRAGLVEKRHLVLARLLRQQAADRGVAFIDLGTDGRYPFYDGYPPTEQAVSVLGRAAPAARRYPSSYGLPGLREVTARLLERRYGVRVDPAREVMVSTGASQVFDALSRVFAGQVVLVPELALSTVTAIAAGNGARVVRVGGDAAGLPDVDAADRVLDELGDPTVRFLYLNSPHNPTGQIADLAYLARLVGWARRRRVLVVHDHDSWAAVHEPGLVVPNVLQVPGAREVAVTVLSVSKELGLPGLRVGLVAGAAEAVGALRVHNSEFCVMLPAFVQEAAAAAVARYLDDEDRGEVDERIAAARDAAVHGWRSLGWPAAAVRAPRAGYKFLVAAPPAFRGDGGVSAAELFDFYVASRVFVKLSTARSFNDDVGGWLRTVLMQRADVLHAAFARMRRLGVAWDMPAPEGLRHAYADTLLSIDLLDL